jgi:hypothetical protein
MMMMASPFMQALFSGNFALKNPIRIDYIKPSTFEFLTE